MAEADDIVINDSEALGVYEPETDEKDTQENRKEESVIGTAVPIINELVDWFNDIINQAGSIDSISFTDKTDLEVQLKASKLVKDMLTLKKSELLARFNNYKSQHEESSNEAE